MSGEAIVQYVGFVCRPQVREYTFSVREVSQEPRQYTVTIPNDAFNSHRVRFQDAPDICSLKLHRELAASGNHPELSHYDMSDAELEAYRSAHAPRHPTRNSRPS